MSEDENKPPPLEPSLPNAKDEELKRSAIEDFERLEKSIFKILPSDCFIKQEQSLSIPMIGSLHIKFSDCGIYSREDVCMLCKVEACPWYEKVSHRWYRTFKILFLNLLAKIFNNPLNNFLKAAVRDIRKK